MHAPVKFHKYIPYGLGVMVRTQNGMDIHMDVQTGRTGVTLNALPLIINNKLRLRSTTSFAWHLMG